MRESTARWSGWTSAWRAPRIGQRDPHTPAVLAAHTAGDQPVLLQAGHQTRQRALAEVDAGRELLHPERTVTVGGRLLGEYVEDLEVTGTEPVVMELAVELAHRPGVQRQHIAPLVDECALGLVRCHERTLAENLTLLHRN